ncbi:MAG: hypothetical protein ACRD0H_21605, partial [Actinomycetes bacterium]
MEQSLLPRRETPPGDAQNAIVELVWHKLPVPGDVVPLDAILDFVSDAETKRRLDRLDIWIRRKALSGREVEDVAVELDEALHDLTNHMRLADMRAASSSLRILVSTPLG